MIKEKAYAKINLALDVVGKRADGYHDLKMIMMPIDLHDILEFELSDHLTLVSNVEIDDNAIIHAAQKLKALYKVQQGATIKLTKNIPIGAGLGGGSADIAATLRGLNRLWELKLKVNELEEIALSLGSDTLFCLYNKTAYVYGRGENLLYVHKPDIDEIYLVTSDISSSTKTIFENHIIKYKDKQFDRLFKLYLNEKYNVFFNRTYNALLKTTLNQYPQLKDTYKTLKKITKDVFMTGSGSTFFILSINEKRDVLEEKLKEYGIQYIKTKPKT
jgi:4-diphosphocytidyl-2-C-methyl-D-erythritol kinase